MNLRQSLKLVGLTALIFVLGIAARQPDKRYFEISKNLEIFTNIYQEVNTSYVEEVDPNQLMKVGVDAMMESLDPFTNYVSENQIERYRYLTEGKYEGIGAKVDMVRSYITIIEPYEGFAAHEAGLKAGDRIVAIEGTSTENKDAEEVKYMLKGIPGSEVELTIERPGREGRFNVALEREEVSVPNVPYSTYLREGIGYISLTTFTRGAGKNVAKAVKELKEDHELKGVILDLRGNGGGLLSEAVAVCNVFVPKGKVVVTTKGKVKDWQKTFKTDGQPVDTDIPVAVLIDDHSASASEIVSGVIQDYDRGVLLGQRTYGKGLVQNTKEVGYNARLKLTTAKYYIPSGRCIQSVAYEDGEPVDIPDSMRAVFHTENGREVRDGGGIAPDIGIDPEDKAPVIKALKRQHMVFRYVTEYVMNLDTVTDPKEYSFADYNAFMAYLDDQNFSYKTDFERNLRKWLKNPEEESVHEELQSELESLKSRVQHIKSDDLTEHQKRILRMIEEDIVGRFHFQKGRLQYKLQHDREVEEAASLLTDRSRYQSILQ